MKVLARLPYARNLWAVISKFNTIPRASRGLVPEVTSNQLAFLLEEMSVDIEERKRAEKGILADDAHEFFDNNTDWWDDPEHNDMFADDTQSDEEFKEQLSQFIDNDTQAKMLTKMEAMADDMSAEDEEAVAREKAVRDELKRRQARVEALLKSGPEGVTKYKKELRNKEQAPDDSTGAPAPDKATSEQEKLAQKALENTRKAIQKGNFSK